MPSDVRPEEDWILGPLLDKKITVLQERGRGRGDYERQTALLASLDEAIEARKATLLAKEPANAL